MVVKNMKLVKVASYLARSQRRRRPMSDCDVWYLPDPVMLREREKSFRRDTFIRILLQLLISPDDCMAHQ
jgi:hypothetical protein